MSDPLLELRSRFERDFLSCLRKTSLKSTPVRLREATEYTLSGKNKRLRPVLCLEASRLAGFADASAVVLASAFECLHTYSLVHDDLPAMDDDDMRRGQPSCHKKYGEATAILVGDLLQSLAFELLAKAQVSNDALLYFARAVGGQGMVAGQFLDMQAGQTSTRRMHRLKTGKLIEASICMPILSTTNSIPIGQIRWARKLGLLFQMTDDLLDRTQNSENLGKTAGKDEAQNKRTIVAELGLQAAQKETQKVADELQTSAPRAFANSPLFNRLPRYLLDRIA